MSTRAIRFYVPLLAAGLFAFTGVVETAHAQRAARQRVKPAQRVKPNNQRQRLNNTTARLSTRDKSRLSRTASRFAGEIRAKFTPVVDIHFTQQSLDAGVRFSKVKNPRMGTKGPTVFEVTGTQKTGGMVHMVLSGGASGHVMQPKYGARPMSTVENYGKTDTIHLTHKGPGASSSTSVIKAQSEGLTTQKGFSMKLAKGTHNFYYFRTNGSMGGSGGEGSEPELRQVTLIVK